MKLGVGRTQAIPRVQVSDSTTNVYSETNSKSPREGKGRIVNVRSHVASSDIF